MISNINDNRPLPEVELSATFYNDIMNEKGPDKQDDMSPRHKLIKEQNQDPTLCKIREKAITEDKMENKATCFYLRNRALMRKTKSMRGNSNADHKEMHQILTPESCKQDILRIANDLPFAGHMGVNKTYSRILPYFYWPGLKRDVT